jgi:hypothetical protein
MKRCTKCGELKELEAFNKNRSTKDGLQSQCRACKVETDRRYREANPEKERERHRRYREANPEKVSEKDRRYYEANSEREREKYRRYRQANPEKVRETGRRYREANPEKFKAHVATNSAIRDGKLIPQPCEVCGEEKVDAHHDDYSKPLEVRWLCHKHHKAHHREENKINRRIEEQTQTLLRWAYSHKGTIPQSCHSQWHDSHL